jgi:beta-glucanase (GH16 family)
MSCAAIQRSLLVVAAAVILGGCLPPFIPTPDPLPTSPEPRGDPGGVGQLVFRDEFSSLDPAVWSRSWFSTTNGYSRPINRAEDGCYHTGQASVSEGVLHLRTGSTIESDCRLRDGTTATIKSGIVSSNEKREFRYGYFEARIHMDGAYNWPAWWTNGHHELWPDRGELDIMELLSCRRPAWHAHYDDVHAGNCTGRSMTGWHTYAMRWTPTRVDFYYDGTLVGGSTVAVPHDHYLVLNHAVRSDYTNGMTIDQDMQVDYVRVWEIA